MAVRAAPALPINPSSLQVTQHPFHHVQDLAGRDGAEAIRAGARLPANAFFAGGTGCVALKDEDPFPSRAPADAFRGTEQGDHGGPQTGGQVCDAGIVPQIEPCSGKDAGKGCDGEPAQDGEVRTLIGCPRIFLIFFRGSQQNASPQTPPLPSGSGHGQKPVPYPVLSRRTTSRMDAEKGGGHVFFCPLDPIGTFQESVPVEPKGLGMDTLDPELF